MPGGRSGGAAMVLGAEYQGRVAAWLAIRALAANAAPMLWNWPQDSVIRRVCLETSDAVDDIRLETDRDDRAFIQVKHRVDGGRSENSPLRKSLDQFVRQASTAKEKDRFVIVTTSESSLSVTRDLPRVLDRIRREQSIREVDSCRNARERTIYRATIKHLAEAWEEAAHRPPEDADLLPILRNLYIATVDLDSDQPGAIEAEGYLRGILADPAQARAAWLDVVSSASETAILQTGITQAWLAERLSDHGFRLGVLTDYRRDVRQLQLVTQSALSRLNQFRGLLGGNTDDLRITRDAVPQLVTAASESLLITGEPGSGKSAALAELIEVLRVDADVVFLSADAVAASTTNDLRSEFQLDHPFAEVLAGWYSDRPGYLVVDALDAGRGSRTQDALTDLIREVIQQKGRFKVIASIRTFDLRVNAALGELFVGRPVSTDPSHQFPELSRIRHFVVPPLTELEVAQACERAPKLEMAMTSASPALRALLLNAFCLRLFTQLVEDGALPDPPISTALELLDAYWIWRVRRAGALATRNELALRVLCDLMIASGALTVDRLGAGLAGHVDALADLLRDGVLAEVSGPGGPSVALGFSHHILFDYAVSRIVVRHSADIGALMAGDNARALLLARPSFQMHFEYLWVASADHHAFWAVAVEVSQAKVPEIVRAIAPAVAARLLRHESDWFELFALLDREHDRDGAVLVLRHLVGAHLADDQGSPNTLAQAQAWAAICADVALRIDHNLAPLVRALMHESTTSTWRADPVVAERIGTAARALMSWCEANGRCDRFYMQVAIPAIVIAFEAAPAENERLLRGLIEPDRLARSGYIEAPALAGEIVQLARTAPKLVQDVYAAIFEHQETSRESTTLTTGVLGLTSNRRQDYESAHYSLTQSYPDFIAIAEFDAISALSRILRAYSRRRGGSDETIELDWEGKTVRLVESHRFWAMDREHDDEVQIQTAFQTWFKDQLELSRGTADDAFGRVLGNVLRLDAPAALWRIVLRSSSSNPERLNKLLPLLTAHRALMSSGLSQPLGEAIRIGFAALPSASTAAIEESIWAIGDDLEASELDNRTRDRLLACIPADAQVTPRTRAHLKTLHAGDLGPVSAPGLVVVEDSDDDDWWLRDNGVDLTDPTNAMVSAMMKPLRALVDDNRGATVDPDVARQAWDGAVGLDDLLAENRSRTAPKLVEWARSDLGRTLALICKSDLPATFDSSDLDRLVDLVVSIATEPDEVSDSNLESFDETPAWSASGRVDCAESMMRLIRMGIQTDALVEPIRTLASNADVELRFAIARMLPAISGSEEAFMWELIDLLEGDPSGAVRTAVINLEARVLINDSSALLERVAAAFTRAASLGPRGENPRKTCIAVTSWLWMWRGDHLTRDFVLDCLSQSDDSTVVEAIQSELRSALEATGADGREIRQRGVWLALAVLDYVQESLHRAVEEATSPAQADVSQKLWHVIDGISSDVYFASGAYGRGEEGSRRRPDESFYDDIRELVRRLSSMPHPSIIHHNLQTLDYLTPVAPAEVFADIAEVLARGRGGGYEYDRIGASFMVAVIQRYLTEHRSIFQSDPDSRRALVDVLDTLVTAGWPDATRLTYQLETVYR